MNITIKDLPEKYQKQVREKLDVGDLQKVRFTIQGRLAGLNEYTQACRSNSFAGGQMKKKQEKIIREAIRQQIGGLCLNRKAGVLFLWVEKNQRRDFDNICFAKKFIMDSLVAEGVLIDDGWKYIRGFRDEFKVDKDNPRVEVTLVW